MGPSGPFFLLDKIEDVRVTKTSADQHSQKPGHGTMSGGVSAFIAGARKGMPVHPADEVDVDMPGHDCPAGNFQRVDEAKKLLCRVSGSMRRDLGRAGSSF